MKRIFSIISGVALLLSGGVFTGCAPEEIPINEEIALGRCLTPTKLESEVTNGEFVEFTWTKSNGATAFVLELYTAAEMTGTPVETFTVKADEVPYTADLEADMVYYARVKAIDESENGLDDSNWANFEESIQTYAIKSSLNPQFVSSTLNSITLKWTADPEVDHVRITPALSADDGKFSTFNIPADAVESAQVTVTGLNPSVKYTLAVHFKSADRGQVVAWTQPDTENAVRVTTIAEFKEAYANGQSKFVFAYSETPYEYGEFKAADFTHDLEIYGEPSEEGEFPTLLMNTKPSATVKKMHFERMHLCGAPGESVVASNYFVNVQNVGQDIESITFLNCKITEFERALYYDNNNGKLGSLVIKECEINTIKQSFIDSRQKGSSVFGSLLIENSTIQNVGNAFLRFAAGVTPSIKLKNNTIYNCGYTPGHNLGFISVAEDIETFTMESNLIIGMTDVSGSNKNQLFVTTKAKDMNKNFFYGCYEDFIGDEDAVAYATAGGAVLTEDPVVDAVGGVFNVTDASVKAATAGDPRWLVEYVEVPEDLTQTVTSTVTTWDLNDAKTFRGKADKDMVRGNIRFYVQNTPFNLGGGKIEFTGKSVVDEQGVPADAGMGIKVNQPGSIVVSTAASELAGAHSHLTVSLNGEVSASVPVGAEYQKVTFPGITEESTIYITACDPIAITFLQWTDDVEVINTVLDTPVLTIDKTSVQERAEDVVTVSWGAIDYAGAYEVTFNEMTTTVTETSFAIETATLSVEEEGADFKVAVKAVPAEDDYIRTASASAEVSFHVNDVPVVDTGGIPSDPEAIETEYKVVFKEESANFPNQTFTSTPTKVGNSKFVVKAKDDGKTKMEGGVIKFGGKSDVGTGNIPTARYMSFKITSPGTIYHMSAASGTSGERHFVIALAKEGSSEAVVLYDQVKTTDGDAEFQTVEVTEEHLEGATAALTVYMYCTGNAVNIKGAGFVPTPSAPAKVDKVWDFSAPEWVEAMNNSGVAANTNDNNFNLEVDGLKVVSGGSSIKWNKSGDKYFWQPGGAGTDKKRYFEFTTDVAGTVTVLASNTGSGDELNKRFVTVKVSDEAEESLPSGSPSNTDPTQTDFSVTPGVVKIYATGNALRFYKIEFHSK